MKYSTLFLFLTLTVSAGFQACSAQEKPSSGASATATAEKPALYLDVRTPEEFASGHVEGAVLIPYDQMETRWQEIAEFKDRPVVVYCRSGRRSGIALDVLEEKGFTKATNGGGLRDLEREGVKVVR